MENDKRQEVLALSRVSRTTSHLELKRPLRDGSAARTPYYSEDHVILYVQGAPYRKLVAQIRQTFRLRQN